MILTFVSGFGGAFAGAFVVGAPWWACFLFGIAGFIIGGVASLLYGGFSNALAGRQGDHRRGLASFLLSTLLPFIAVLLVAVITVGGALMLSHHFWPDRLDNNRTLGLEESW